MLRPNSLPAKDATAANGDKQVPAGLDPTPAGLDELKIGLARMLKGGVIMDVTNVEQAKIAEDAGACAVMALERVPSDIRKEGGVARMAALEIVEAIQAAVTIPVMAKASIGHFVEARIEQVGVDFIDESEVLTPADPRTTSTSAPTRFRSCAARPASTRRCGEW
jgi:pyridoxal 5'-phosphate synthase pdxS subunit